MAYLLGIDIGTSGVKALLIEPGGRVLASSTYEYPLHTPRPGWAEQDPQDWWRACLAGTREVIRRSGISSAEIRAVGLSGQMHGAVLLGAEDRVLRPAILWCDQRTAAQCDWITRTVGQEQIVKLTLNPVLTGFQAPKIIWVRDNEPEIYEQIRKVLLPKDYIRLLLTGEYATEVSDASGTSLFNVTERRWCEPILSAVQIPREWLPIAYESYEVTGHITPAAAELTGLKAGTPVVGGGGDQAAGAVGSGIVRPGVVSSTVGTSGVVFAFSDLPTLDPKLRVHTFCHAVPRKWHVMGVMLSAGGSLRWLRDTIAESERAVALGMGRDPYDLMGMEAAAAPAGSEGLIFLPYLTGERTPHPDPNARGVLFGLGLRHHRSHLVRSVMEGVAYGLKDTFEIFREMNVPVNEVRASGGGARSGVWRQIHADVTGFSHSTINVDEGPALGVALLAGVGSGIYSSVEQACDDVVRTTSVTEPDPDREESYRRYYEVYRSLYPALRDAFEANALAVQAAQMQHTDGDTLTPSRTPS
ncbi:MAG: xylulokinase [Chloroflexi bacterium]|nr:xylulokinase [Chloroflexota bacterium]